MNTRVGLVALSLAGTLLFGPSVRESAAPHGVEATFQVLPDALPAEPPSKSIASLPTVTATKETAVPVETAPPWAGYAAASLPSLDPKRFITSLPTVTPTRESAPVRTRCDPSYPEKRTCIPPGPPFDQGCAITDERRFTVLPAESPTTGSRR